MSFAAALGLPKVFHHDEMHEIHRIWRMRLDQYLFLQQEEDDKSAAVHLWDERHKFFFLLPISSLFSLAALSFYSLFPCQ